MEKVKVEQARKLLLRAPQVVLVEGVVLVDLREKEISDQESLRVALKLTGLSAIWRAHGALVCEGQEGAVTAFLDLARRKGRVLGERVHRADARLSPVRSWDGAAAWPLAVE